MQKGNWIPLDKALVKSLPRGRIFSEVEAAFSLSLDYDCGKSVTVSGYASRWGWSRKRVKKFIKDMGAEIVYPQDTAIKRNQKGHIGLHKENIKGTYKGHKRMIDSKDIPSKRNIKGTYKGHIRDIKGSTTIYPKSLNLNPNPKKKDTEQARIHLEVISFFNKTCGTNYKPTTKSTVELINGRISDGFAAEDFKTVIVKKYKQWKDNPEFSQFITPQTLFRPTKFETYLNQKLNGEHVTCNNLKPKSEIINLLKKSIAEPTEEAMRGFLKQADKQLHKAASSYPFLFETKEREFSLVYEKYARG